jgi:DNA-binding CsgD family transcriptional regulator
MNREGRLNASEKRVLQLIHLPNKLIAQKMCISVSTVKTYICNLLEAYKQKTRTGLLLLAIKLGYVDIHKVDIGFWDKNGNYIENIELVDFRKE